MERKQTRPSTATAKVPAEYNKKKKPTQMLTYKDYTIKEEKGGVFKQILTPKTAQLNFLRTTASSRPQTASAIDSYQFKQRVEQKFQNFIQKRDVIDDDDSLLQDSQKSREKSEKQQILEIQKAQRRKAAQEKKRIELEKTQKVKDGLDELNRKVRQNIKNQAKRERQSKSRERSRERSLKKRTADLVKKHAPDRSGGRQGAAAQLQDLKSWIEEQMHEDGVDDSNLDSEEKDGATTKNKENNSHNTVLSLKDVGITNDQQKLKMLKHQLPGNHLLSEKEESKLGVRQNRYGVFETGQSEFEKVVEIQREKLEPKKEEVKKQPISQADQQKSKEHVRDLIMQLAQRSGMVLQSQAKSIPADSKVPANQPIDDLSEDSCDKIPVRQSDKTQTNRPVLNVKASDKKVAAETLPGVTDTRKKQEALDKAQKEKEAKATLVIQKFLRGHWGRREAARQLYRRKNEIEAEYSRFQSEYKNNQGYNLKQYIRDKQNIRQKNGFDSMDEIAEAIGESSSTTTAHIVQSSVKVQNFFKFGHQTTEFDPLSLISIYAKRHSKPPEQKTITSTVQKSSKKQHKDKLAQSSSIIEEDIYSEDFDNEIPEDIQKASSSASTIPKPKRQTAKSTNKNLIESDSIVDEAPSAAISKSDSIADEVDVATKDNSDIESSIQEDSIIRNEFDSDNYKVSNAKKQLEARTRVSYGMKTETMADISLQRQQILLQVEEAKRTDKIKTENLVGNLLNQMREFESAALSQTMMDRMEKIVTSSLAQKDQIIMAQRLAELERENRHKEEINRIREEQIRLMSQLMLLGNAGATQNQRDEIINSIRSIAEQPIVIREQPVFTQHQASMPVPLTHQQLYQQNKRTKVTYLDEYDQSKRSNKFSSGKYSDMQESKPASSKQRELRDDLSDDIVDEVGSVKSDSIAEEIEESLEKSTSGSYEEFKARQFKLVQGSKTLLATYVADVEKAINRQKDQKEQVLTSKLRQKKLSPRSYQRKRADLEEWANRERRDVKEKHAVLQRKQQQADEANRKFDTKAMVEESNDSDQVKKAIYQANLLDKGIIGVSPDQRYIQRKKEAAEQLIKEKEKVIQEQLNSKIQNLEKELADEVLQQALEIDVEKEVERRFQAVKRQLEDSVGVESARSGVSQSKDSASKQKKSVKFQESEKLKQPQIETSNGIEESIDEAINSGSYTQSFKSSSAIESKSKSLPVSQPESKPTSPAIAKPAVKNQKVEVDQSDSIAEMISDNYTDDFSEGGVSESKNTLEQSKTRLQTKAKELTESAAYSEDGFEEESMGQSQSAGAQNAIQQAAAKKKMESVLEESIDESAGRSKTSSRMESTNQFQQSEVPSEDQEVNGSAQSVDWQIQIPQESARTGQDFEKDSIREDSSLARDENDDEFESNPEDIGRSASMSNDDLLAKADIIAQGLLDQILKEYKDDNSYIVSCEKKQIDEDNFRDKFPYTLDVKPVEPEIRPPVLPSQNSARSTASSPAKRVKTAKEIQDEAFMKKHEKEQGILKQQNQRVADYLAFLISKIDMNELIKTLDTPIELNPLAILAQIQAYEDEEPPRLESQPEQQQVLPQSFFVRVDKEYHNLQRQNKSGQQRSPTAAEKEQESLMNVHNYAIFEAFNEALDQRRPYKNKGQPMPWSKNTRVARQETTLEEAKQIVQQASKRVIEWSETGAGSKYAPLPPPPTQTQDEFGEEIVQPPLQDGEEDRKNQYRQEKLGYLMTKDIQETDNLWTDYEVEDTQVRFDLADMILADLASEIAALLK